MLFHSSPVGGHSGVAATFQKVTSLLYCRGLKKDVREFVRNCEVCQRNKYDTSASPGLLQLLPIPDGIFSNISMDFITGLPKSQGKDVILVVVDRLTKYGHFMSVSHPYGAATVAQIFIDQVYRLHGLPSSIVSDRDAVFVSNLWQELFKQLGVTLCLSSSYHPQTDGQTEVVNRCIESYLRCMAGERPTTWAKWIPLAEWWYNTSYHSTIKMTLFEALYGFTPPFHIPYFPKDSKIEAIDALLRDREEGIKLLKFYLERAQNRMKQVADRKRSERHFKVGDWVYMKLQPYRQHTLKNHRSQKLQPKYFGPFKILERVGSVAYRLDLPKTSLIHPTIHVSQLKLAHASKDGIVPLPSEINEQRLPETVLERRMVKRGNKAATKILVKWVGHSMDEATWIFLDDFKKDFPDFDLEDKLVA